jgi:hypothetical protein
MRRTRLGLFLIQASLLLALAFVLWATRLPLGVRGEWEWPRVPVTAAAIDVALAALGALAYAVFASVGFRSLALERDGHRTRQAAWLAALVPAATLAQLAVLSGAPLGYGLTKWATLGMRGSSGYYTVARTTMGNPRAFWANYPRWIKAQDSLHIGTHPPGLFLASRTMLDFMRQRPGVSQAVVEHLPSSVDRGFREILGPLPRADRAALGAIGMLTLLACMATSVPLYILARLSGLARTAAWAAAACWPLVPAAIMFQPAADTAFPLLSTTALALIARRSIVSSTAAGVVMAIGMQFSLVFLPTGAIAAVMLLVQPTSSVKRRLLLVACTGVGFLVLTLALWAHSKANPFAIWWVNQQNHARFYVEYPRRYLAWIVENPVELAVALGLPFVALILAGLRRAPLVSWVTLALLLALTVSGKNLSEVARLWLPFMPALLLPIGTRSNRESTEPWQLGATLLLTAIQTLVLQSAIQLVYPV